MDKYNDEEQDEIEDATKYGEFIPSYFAWVTLQRQRENANRLEKITNKRTKEK